MIKKLGISRTTLVIKFAFAAGAKASAALAAFALTALVTRNMPENEAGLFLLGFTVLAVFAVVSRLGLDNVILRILSAHGTDNYAQEKLNRGLLWASTVSLPLSLLGMLYSNQIATNIFGKPAFAPVLFWMLPALPAMAIFFLLSYAFQSQHRVILTTVFQNLGISTFFILGIAYLWFVNPEAINSTTAAQIYSIAAFIVLMCSLVVWLRQKNVNFSIVAYKDPVLGAAAINLWTAALMGLMVQWTGVIAVGAMLPIENVALYSAAQRTAALISFVLMVFNLVASPRYARYWSDNRSASIEKLAKMSSMAMSILAVPVFLIMVVFPDYILSIFGESYTSAKYILSIMAFGQFINVMTGSVGMLLNMTGHEKEYRVVIVISGLITIVLSFYLTFLYGIIGAAIATTIGMSAQNIWAAILVKRILGFWIIGKPSVER